MAYFELATAFLLAHCYSIEEDKDSDFALVDGPAPVAGVYSIAVVVVAKVTLLDSKQLVHSEVVLGVVLLVVVDSACCLAH